MLTSSTSQFATDLHLNRVHNEFLRPALRSSLLLFPGSRGGADEKQESSDVAVDPAVRGIAYFMKGQSEIEV